MPRSWPPFLFACVLLASGACSQDGRWQKELNYEVVRQKVFDEPPRTQVDRWIAVSGQITEYNLRRLLRAQYDSVMTDTGYTANERPTNVYIYLFSSKAAAQEGGTGWLGMLEKRPDREVSIRVRGDTVSAGR